MKKILSILLVALMLLSVCAFAEDIEIAVVPKALDNAIFLDAKTAAEEKGKELGIKIFWEGPTTSDAAMQVNVIESLIERQVDGILISCNDADALKMFTGLSSADKISGAAASEAMMGSQAYSLVVVKVKDAKNAETVLEEMVNGIDQRKWICVEADDLSAAAVGDVVVLMMVDSEYADTITSKDVIDAFSGICGGLDARV